MNTESEGDMYATINTSNVPDWNTVSVYANCDIAIAFFLYHKPTGDLVLDDNIAESPGELEQARCIAIQAIANSLSSIN